jgi:hypothetical protein
MTESSNLKSSFMYKLAKSPGLSWFKHVIICASSQDNYVPYDSARIQLPSQSDENSKIIEKMVHRIMN